MKSDIDSYPVILEVPVAWGDMDAFAHVNNAVYFRYFESARILYFDRMEVVDAASTPKKLGPILASTACRFKAPVTYPDTLRVGARIRELQQDRFVMEYAAHSERLGRIAAVGEGVVVAYDYELGKKVDVPEAWRRRVEEIEASSS